MPENWKFVSVAGPDAPDILPKDEAGKLEFAWINIPDAPIKFSYTVNIPADTVGTQHLRSKVKYRRSSGELIEPVLPDPPVFKKCKGDFDEDYDVDGGDLVEFVKDEKGVKLKRFAEEFGRVDCH